MVNFWIVLLWASIFNSWAEARQAHPHASPAHTKALRSRQIGTEREILNRLFTVNSDYDSNTRPPVRGCHIYLIPTSSGTSSDFIKTSNKTSFILCLLTDYADHSAIVVIASVYVNRVSWYRDKAEVDLYLRQQWQDSRLSYEVDTREAIHEVTLPANRNIWKPDTFFVGVDEKNADSTKSRIVIEPSGYVRFSQKRSVTIPIETLHSYPFSAKKRVFFKLSSYNYPIEDIVYLWANSPPNVLPVEVSPELLDENADFSFEDASAGDCVGNYSVGVYSCINVQITFKGCTLVSEFLKVFFPCVLLVIASWLHFWINGSWSVPRTISASVPFFIFVLITFLWKSIGKPLQVFLLACIVMTFLSLVEYFLVIFCGARTRVRNAVLHPPTTTKVITQQQRDPYQQHPNLGAREDSSSILITKETVVETTEPTRSNFIYSNQDVDVIARIAFPILFGVFLIIYFIVYTF